MNYILIVFASVTTANRIKTLLAKKFGIDSVVIQTPKSIGEKTCSYCLKAKEEHMEMADQRGVDYKGYTQLRNKRCV